MTDISFHYRDLINSLRNEFTEKIDLAIVLGSGFGVLMDSLRLIKSIPYSEIPGYPPVTVEGHRGILHLAEQSAKNILIFEGRNHFYEGHPIENTILNVLITRFLGIKNLLITNAAGGINQYFRPGDLMLIKDFSYLNLKKEMSELIGQITYDQRNNFQSMPSPLLSQKLENAALLEGIPLKYGVYWYVKGPNYETPAEIRMIKRLGGDAVGMSSASEAVMANLWNINVAGISCITNFAAGLSDQKLSHAEVKETALMTSANISKLITRFTELL